MKTFKFLVATIAILGLTTACERIETGNVGIETLWGQVKEKTLEPGLYQTFTKTIYEVSTREIGVEFRDMRPRTLHNLILEDLDVDIYVKVNPVYAAKIYTKYAGDVNYDKNVGAYTVGMNYVTRQARETIYTASALYDAATMHQKRPEIAETIQKMLQKSLDIDMGKDWVTVTAVNIRNLVTDKQMEDNIRKIAQQELQRKEEIEAQKTLIETNKKLLLQKTGIAQAEAERALIEAKNKAEMLVIEAQAQAKSNELITQSLTVNLLRFREIEMTAKFAEKGSSTFFMPQGQTVTPLVNVGK